MNNTSPNISPLDRQFEHLPPNSPEAEIAILGVMLGNAEACDEIISDAEPDWFYLTDNATIFSVIVAMRRENHGVDAITLKAELTRIGKWIDVGGMEYMLKILDWSRLIQTGWQHYLDTLRDCLQGRRAIAIGTKLISDAYSRQSPAADILAIASESIVATVTDAARTDVTTLDDILADVKTDVHNPNRNDRFVSFGFPTIDEAIGVGLGESEVALIAARPSMGKSTLMRQIALLAALRRDPVLYVSLEEAPRKVGRNLLSWQCGIINKRMRGGRLDRIELSLVDEKCAELKGLPFHFVWGQSNAAKLHAIVSSYKARYGIKLVMLDYLQLLNAGGKTPYERATESSRAIVRIARSLNVATICAAQLNRANTTRDDKRPSMADIRDSGQIEQDADVILLLHREDYYHFTDPTYPQNHEAELIRGKTRDSERGGDPIKLRSELMYQAFVDPQWPVSGEQQEAFVDQAFGPDREIT